LRFLVHVLVDVDLLSALPNQIVVERLEFAFIANVEFEKVSPFCSNCKMIGHYLSNYRRLQQNANVISSGEKIVSAKIQQHYHPKVIGAQDGTKGSLVQVVELVVESMVKPVIQSFMVKLVAQSQLELVVDNHDNICVVNESYLVNNLDGCVQVKFYSLTGVLSLEDVNSIVNNL